MVSPLRTRQRITVLMNCSRFIILSICLFWFWGVCFFLISFYFYFFACLHLLVCLLVFVHFWRGRDCVMKWFNLFDFIKNFFLAISYYNYIHKPIRGRKKGQILQAIFYAWKLIIKPAVSEAGGSICMQTFLVHMQF